MVFKRGMCINFSWKFSQHNLKKKNNASFQITKDEYDDELRTFLSKNQIRFHNKFILSMLTRCSNSVLSSAPFILTELDFEPNSKKIKLEDIDSTFKYLQVRILSCLLLTIKFK